MLRKVCTYDAGVERDRCKAFAPVSYAQRHGIKDVCSLALAVCAPFVIEYTILYPSALSYR